MRVHITYCKPCGYQPRANSLAAKISSSFPAAQVEFTTGIAGEFVVEVDGEVLWDRKQMQGQFPDEESLVSYLTSRTAS